MFTKKQSTNFFVLLNFWMVELYFKFIFEKLDLTGKEIVARSSLFKLVKTISDEINEV